MDAKTGHAILSDQIKKIDPSNTYDVVGILMIWQKMKFKLWDRDIERKPEGVGIPQIEKVDWMLLMSLRMSEGCSVLYYLQIQFDTSNIKILL